MYKRNRTFHLFMVLILTISTMITVIMPVSVAAASFTDVASGAYYAEPVAWAVDKGITRGTSDTTFSPDTGCTRAQVVTFLYRYAGSPEVDAGKASKFTDVKSSDDYASAVAWAVLNDVTTGISDTTFGSEAECSRAQIATFLWRYRGNLNAEQTAEFEDVTNDNYYANAVSWSVELGITKGTSEVTFSPDLTCTRAQAVTFLYRLKRAVHHDTDDSQMRGIWLSYNEYAPLGLSIYDDEEAYRDNADRFLKEAQKYRINTVFLHARAFDDAFWRSKIFHATKYVGGDENLIAENAYDQFDPFGVFLEEAHKYGIEVHAWLNPYRVTYDYFYDPGENASTERLLAAIKELLVFESNGEKIDGIHLDDYFYHARKGYYKVGNPSYKYAIVSSADAKPESREYHVVTSADKRKNVNRMVKEIYSVVSEADIPFGISPAGNYDNDMNDGADIDTWLSEEGYLDYIIPQIYWSNQWGEEGNVTMFTDRLNLFLSKRNNNAKFYVGLGLYRTAELNSGNDPGWRKRKTNLEEQIDELERKNADGYVFFSAQYLMRNCAEAELLNLRK